jgi:hypothetical protein
LQIHKALMSMAWLDLKHAELMRALLAVVRATRPAFNFLALADIYTAAERLRVNDAALFAMLEDAMMATSQHWNSNTARQLLGSFARVCMRVCVVHSPVLVRTSPATCFSS